MTPLETLREEVHNAKDIKQYVRLYLYFQWEEDQRKDRISDLKGEIEDVRDLSRKLYSKVSEAMDAGMRSRPTVFNFEKTAGIITPSPEEEGKSFTIQEATKR